MDGLGKEVSGATSFIDKLSDGKYFLCIMNIFFLLDSCLVLFYGKNISDLDFIINHIYPINLFLASLCLRFLFFSYIICFLVL
jgi:hypothetical protein